MQPKFYYSNEPVEIHRQHLPHWRQSGVTYFITSRLGDSMPQEKLRQWESMRHAWLCHHGIESTTQLAALSDEERRDFQARFTDVWHDWLDAGHGACVLREPAIRAKLEASLLKHQGSHYELDAWVIMPNHFHALVTVNPDNALSDIVKGWKGGSSVEINRLLGRSGALWQKEAYDHIVRSSSAMKHHQRYIANNPIKSALPESDYSAGRGSIVWPSARALLEALAAEPPQPK